MSDRFHADAYDPEPFDPFAAPPPEVPREHPPLPEFLARRLLRTDERVVWVAGPRFAPSWERYVTHPLLFVAALVAGMALVLAGMLAAGSLEMMPVAPALIAFALVIGSIIVLGFFSGYFTRLVVTTSRLFIVQGREACRSWDVNDLPPSLLRYRMERGREEGPTIDLSAVRTMLGGSSDRFVDANTILAFGKELRRINKDRTDGRS